MKHSYIVQSCYDGKWINVISDTRDFCVGYLHAKKGYAPRNAYRLTRGDGKVIVDLPAVEDVSVGQVAGWPTPEQYEAAAQRALDQAARIRERAAQQDAMRAKRLAATATYP